MTPSEMTKNVIYRCKFFRGQTKFDALKIRRESADENWSEQTAIHSYTATRTSRLHSGELSLTLMTVKDRDGIKMRRQIISSHFWPDRSVRS